MSLKTLLEKAKEFKISDDKLQADEEKRVKFISRFPLSSLKNLSLEQYAEGIRRDSFCYWLEFKDIPFGIGGGNASKFGVYKAKDGQYYSGFDTNKILLEGKELEDKFLLIKASIIRALELVEQNKVDKIVEIETLMWRMVLQKILSLYYPDKFITIGAPNVLIECARDIQLDGCELIPNNSILINHLLLQKLNKLPEFVGWEYNKIGSLIWVTYEADSKRDYYIIGSKYGINSDKDIFPEMLRRSIIATGFAPNLDMSKFYNENHSAIKEYLLSHNEENNSINALKHFLSLRSGDLVAVKGSGSPKGKEGYLSILGIAEVIEKNGKVYEHEPSGLGHIINVKYLESPIFKELVLGGYGRTIHKLSNDEHIKLIFKTENEMNFYGELIKFLAQAETVDLGTSDYINNFQGLSVKVSFGKGNQARIPWIAFLKANQTVQNGIYPVYLFYKEKKLLILAYGMSETNNPISSWNLPDSKKIESYFTENNLGMPERYGNSFAYKAYKTNQPFNEKEINDDLNNIILIYNQTLLFKPSKEQSTRENKNFEHKIFFQVAKECGLSITSNICLRFIASILTKPFVILTGLSGSGKTKLAQAFATWICENENQYCIVPVGADWTNREPLLGFPNALEPGKYVKPDNRVLDLIISSNENPDKPYFLILDEMNLSHVERYFADFLSVMESKKEIPLHSDKNGMKTNDEKIIPHELKVPKNLFIIGTVNIDETTYMFSPKVLDRASVIEFRVTATEMGSYLSSNTGLDLESLKYVGANMAGSFVEIALDEKLLTKNAAELNKTLLDFFGELKKTGAEFGYRSASEIIRFAAVVNMIESTWTTTDIIDAAIMQKLLPKVHGSRKKLEGVLLTLARLCVQDAVKNGKDFKVEILLNSEDLA